MTSYRMILASGSPRRRQLLSDLGFRFEVRSADIDESPLPQEKPDDLALRLAETKGLAVARALESGSGESLIIAADTVVSLDERVFGKPVDSLDAEQMLMELRGKWHQVHSAVCVVDSSRRSALTTVHTTQVLMRDYSLAEVRRYVASGDPMDKAGAYAIQNEDFSPVLSIDGCVTGVMGMPLADFCALIEPYGIAPESPLVDVCERHIAFPCCQRRAKSPNAFLVD